jgi:hypothetical protein
MAQPVRDLAAQRQRAAQLGEHRDERADVDRRVAARHLDGLERGLQPQLHVAGHQRLHGLGAAPSGGQLDAQTLVLEEPLVQGQIERGEAEDLRPGVRPQGRQGPVGLLATRRRVAPRRGPIAQSRSARDQR